MDDTTDDDDRIIDRHELRSLVPFHPSHLARLEVAGQFPRRIQLSQSRVGWSLHEVRAWIEKKKQDRK